MQKFILAHTDLNNFFLYIVFLYFIPDIMTKKWIAIGMPMHVEG